MDAIDALGELVKAKYTKRWKGSDGKWRYEYGDKGKGGGKGGDKKQLDLFGGKDKDEKPFEGKVSADIQNLSNGTLRVLDTPEAKKELERRGAEKKRHAKEVASRKPMEKQRLAEQFSKDLSRSARKLVKEGRVHPQKQVEQIRERANSLADEVNLMQDQGAAKKFVVDLQETIKDLGSKGAGSGTGGFNSANAVTARALHDVLHQAAQRVFKHYTKKSMSNMDAIDALGALVKGGDDEDAYLAGYKDAQAGKPPKVKSGGGDEAEEGDEEGEGTDLDGDGDADVPEEGGDDENAPEAADVDPQDDPGTSDEPMDGPDAVEEGGEEEGEEEGPDAIDKLGDLAGEEGEENVDLPAEEGDGDSGDLELPDDGDNHGVGDLNQDGETQSLVQEVANLEKLYYASKGLHGAGSVKAEKALEVYHAAVRKLARKILGGKKPGEVGGDQGQGQDPQMNQNSDNEPGGGKKPPFKKSLQKGSGSPYDYLMGQIRDLTKECQKAATGDDRYDPGKIAPMVIAKMVDRFTHDGTLREASTLYNVNMQAVEAVIRQDGLLGRPASDDPAIPSDEDGHRAMGVEGSLRLSMDGSDLKVTDNVFAQGAQGLRLVKSEPERVTLVDDRVDPFSVLAAHRKRQVAGMAKGLGAAPQELPRFTVDAACPFHGAGPDAVYKSHLIHSGYMECTCPKKDQ